MSDDRTFPPGWYADPDDAGVHRWWNGSQWTDARQPAQPAAPAQSAAPAVPPVPPLPVPAAAAPPAPAPMAAPAYPAAPTAYPAYPTASVAPAVAEPRDIPTNTPWIWLVVLLPLLNLPFLFLLDWRGFLVDNINASIASPSTAWTASFTGITLLLTGLGYLIIALQALFAWLDWRTLRARGIVKPFHWAWIFFTLVISNGVYVIGRGVVLRRQTGTGLLPIWIWIAVNVLSLIVGISFAVWMINEVFALIPGIVEYPTAP
jgi:hypothetical protein